jgi:hypothetical protein
MQREARYREATSVRAPSVAWPVGVMGVGFLVFGTAVCLFPAVAAALVAAMFFLIGVLLLTVAWRFRWVRTQLRWVPEKSGPGVAVTHAGSDLRSTSEGPSPDEFQRTHFSAAEYFSTHSLQNIR